jgi:hypothetical protein
MTHAAPHADILATVAELERLPQVGAGISTMRVAGR